MNLDRQRSMYFLNILYLNIYLQCAVKFTRAPIEINTSGNPLWSGAGTLPYLKIGRQKLVGYQKIKEFLDSEV